MSEYPHNTAAALAALYPDVPPDSWQVYALSNGNTEITGWQLPGDPPTPAEIIAYLNGDAFAQKQRAQSLHEKWAAQQTARQRREAKAILAAPENETTVDQRINAINLLNGVR